MATWIVHLRLAEKLLDHIEDLDSAYFSIGNIAPDSGIPDENWEKFDPPAEVLHFHSSEGEKWEISDLDFYRQYLVPLKEGFTEKSQLSFLLGYFFHLVTDNLWSVLIGKPTRERFASQFESDPKFVWQVKRDWYGLDFEYIRAHPDSLFWQVFLDSQYEEDYLDFLPQEAVQIRLDYIKEFYQRTDEKVQEWYGCRPDRYLTKPDVDKFIETATSTLTGAYTHLWLEAGKVPDSNSILGHGAGIL